MANKLNRKYPKVLIISHNPFSVQNNGKTLAALFKHWDIHSLAQLYLTTDIPEFSICNKYFQLHDMDIIKKVLLMKHVQGRRVTDIELSEIKSFKTKIVNSEVLKLLRNNNIPLFQLIRDLLWDIAGYKTRELTNFVDDFNPQIVFFHSSYGAYAFSLVKWICRKRNIPLIMQTTDDYVSGKLTLDPFFWIQHYRIKNAYKWAVGYSDCIVAIGDKMAKEYRCRFGGKYFVAMNSMNENPLPEHAHANSTIRFLYAGNLGLNRWKVLSLIGECIEDLHKEEGLNGELIIYSLAKPGTKALSLLTRLPFSSFRGSLNTNELDCAKARSDILVHVEAFDRKNRFITRLSISTKIPEYLASGRCIFAVGPKDVASMQYLSEYNLGVTVMSDDKANIKKALKEIMIDIHMRDRYAKKGIEVAKMRHDADKTAESIYRIISATIDT